MPIFGRRQKTFPIPAILPKTCPKCGARLHWTPVTIFDPVIRLEKVDYYKAECSCGEVHYRVHHMFLAAPDDVVKALAHFAGAGRRRRQAGHQIDSFVKYNRAMISPTPRSTS